MASPVARPASSSTAPGAASAPAPERPRNAAVIVSATALAYAAVGTAALLLAGPAAYASPLFPSAGIALVAALVFGRSALAGVLIGSFSVNLGLGALHGHAGLASPVLPLMIGAGAALQAAMGAALVRRGVSQPLVLNQPRDILRFALLSTLACTVNPTVATVALLATGALPPEAWAANWVTWWVGDSMGVLIGAPLALSLVGRPAADWHPRRRTLGLPLLLAVALLAAGIFEFGRVDRQRQTAGFERDTDRLVAEAQARLSAPLYALQALHSAARARGTLDGESLRQAARWWLAQPIHLQAAGFSERVQLDRLPAFEADARTQGSANFRVFDRDGGVARAADREVVALRFIEPLASNAAAVGINALSIPAARSAIVATRDSGQPASTPGFLLTQSTSDETGVVIYQALYRDEPQTVEARRAQFSGVVFVTLRTEAAMAGLASAGQRHLRWCLVDSDSGAERRRLAGEGGCDRQAAARNEIAGLQARRTLLIGGRPVELHIIAPAAAMGQEREAAWILSLAGVASAAMLGALLLTVTGHSRRTELAVQAGTAELRHEIAERSQAQHALAESEARLRSILDHVPLGVMFLDPAGRLLDANARFADMLGISLEERRGLFVVDLVHPADGEQLLSLRRSLLKGGSDQVLDRLRLRHADGRPLIGRLSASALRDPEGRVLRMVGVLEDITQQLRLEESERALHRAEAASRAKNEFLSRMSHELRTPLNAMIGFAQLLGLDRGSPLATHQQEWTQQIQRAGWHLLEMINETLDLARIESGAEHLKLEAVALPPLVQACESMVSNAAAQRGIVLAHTIAEDAAGVLGDPTRVKQVLINLLSNAVKYNRAGGAVTLSTRLLRRDDADWVEIAVADSGLGMTPTQVGDLFQPYNRLGRENSAIEGTGIGLVISRRLTELMGGTLDVRSQPTQGSTFTLRLPAAVAALPDAPAGGSLPASYPQRLVHYVEDNETNIEVMRGVFAQRSQIRLETSTLGLDGLAAIRQTRPDLILLDMHLPDISGLELLRHVKQDDAIAHIPVLVVSADATAGNMQEALTSGALRYVTKPLDIRGFLETVDGILDAVESRWAL